jgi:hypothetical protein
MARGRAFIGGVVVAASLGFGVGAVATSGASSSASSATYYGCLKAGSLINVTTLSHKCAVGASPISWNATGPAGLTGATGAKGDTGPKGDTGAKWTAPQGGFYVFSQQHENNGLNPPDTVTCPTGETTGNVFTSHQDIHSDNPAIGTQTRYFWNWLCPIS